MNCIFTSMRFCLIATIGAPAYYWICLVPSLHFNPSGKCFTAALYSAKSLLDINGPSCGLNELGPFSTFKKYRKTTDPICFQQTRHLPTETALRAANPHVSVLHRRQAYQMTSVLTIGTMVQKLIIGCGVPLPSFCKNQKGQGFR